MLLKRAALDRIASGEVDVVFRRWRKPTVRSGGQLRTAVGMLEIDSVRKVTIRSITAADAHRAGYATRTDLIRDLSSGRDGDVYRIDIRPGGSDPLIELRERDQMTDEEMADVTTRLDRLDRSRPWTRRYLELIGVNPHVRAQDLADSLGEERHVFKNDVRKLKALGLTISHSPGYELSPRGRAVLRNLDAGDRNQG